jgi:succinate dehydrogenase/fumarate reductase flavoprotein subunit
MSNYNKLTTDILVIGGGWAGLFSAIEAAKEGANVVQMDKGRAGKSGQSPYTDSFCPFMEEWGHDMKKWLQSVAVTGEYVNDHKWTKAVLEGSGHLFDQLMNQGIEFLENPDGSIFKGNESGDSTAPTTIFYSKNRVLGTFRKTALAHGVTLLEKMMVTELIKENNKVVGAMAIDSIEAKLTVIEAKATIMCAGAVGFKPHGWPIHALTGDSDALAYRVGAEILGKEFVDTHDGDADMPGFIPFAEIMGPEAMPNIGPYPYPNENCDGHPPKAQRRQKTGPPITNAYGKTPKYNREGLWLTNEFEVHAGNGPLKMKSPRGVKTMIGGITLGMASHKTEGIVAKDDLSCMTQVEGLFAAGDALGNMAAGGNYPFMGFAMTSACVTGNMAGKNAAEYVKTQTKVTILEEKINSYMDRLYAPLNRNGGFSPRWVNQTLKNILIPYFILYIKHEDRLKGALSYNHNS